MTATLADPVRRVLARDTMLTLANDAEEAMIIVRNRDRMALVVGDQQALFMKAVEDYIRQAETTTDPPTADPELMWSLRGNGYAHAATILRFCLYMGIPLSIDRDVEALYTSGLAELRAAGKDRPALDRLAEVTMTYRIVRSLRAAGRFSAALRLASTQDLEFFYASGAEPRAADIQFETGACLLEKGQAGQVFSALGELEKTYWDATLAASFSTRHRYGFILALADCAVGRTDVAVARMQVALDHLLQHRVPDTRHDVYELSLTLALAEFLAASKLDSGRAVTLAERALDIAERIRGRWGVIARARTPLSVAFRRVYGDVALLASRLRGAAAARLGLRVCLSAKQTGFAGHMRAGEALLPNRLRGLVSEVLSAERVEQLDPAADIDAVRAQREHQDRALDYLHSRIEKRVNPMLADMILPTPADLTHLLQRIGDRYALDLAGLPDSLTDGPSWFRSLTEPSGTIHFEQFTPPADFAQHLEADDPDWRGLASEILPERLRGLLGEAVDEPLELVVSAHQELCLLPWAALIIDAAGTRLLQCAVLTQTPVLTCLSGSPLPIVSDPALVRLVSRAECGPTHGLWIELERDAWRLRATDGAVPLSRCTLDGQPPRAVEEARISAVLAGSGAGWRFLHIAAHGGGGGLDQYLVLPGEILTGGRLSAAHALALHWPESTLMASCRVGRVANVEDAEPLGFVMAVLTGGGRCVAAAIDNVASAPASRMAARLVKLAHRPGGIRLDHALRLAQLELASDGEPVTFWARFQAYVR